MPFSDTGFSIIKLDNGQALAIPQNQAQPAILQFVGVSVEYDSAALVAPGGGPIAGVRVKIGELVGDYVPLSDVSVATAADKIPKRNVDGEIFAASFRGGNLRGFDNDSVVSITTNNQAKGISVARSPGGAAMVGAFGRAPVELPIVNLSDPDQVNELRNALVNLGWIDTIGGPAPSASFVMSDYPDRQTDFLPPNSLWTSVAVGLPNYPYADADLTEVADALISIAEQTKTVASILATLLVALRDKDTISVTE